MRDLVSFVQFKKREKHPWRGVSFSKVAGFKPATLLKLTLLHGCFSRLLNCTNGTKSRNAPHIPREFMKILMRSFRQIPSLAQLHTLHLRNTQVSNLLRTILRFREYLFDYLFLGKSCWKVDTIQEV